MAVVATVVTVRVDTDVGMLARARRVAPLESSLLSCKRMPLFEPISELSELGYANWEKQQPWWLWPWPWRPSLVEG